MSLLELLNARIKATLERAGFDGLEDEHRTARGYDPDDFLIRQELQLWAGHQKAPGRAKLRLLQAAALQKDIPVSKKEKTDRKKPKHYPPESWGREFQPSYLTLAFQFNHVRLIA